MIGELLGAIVGGQSSREGEDKGIGSLIVIGIILFVLLGGLKLFQKQDDNDVESSSPGVRK